MIQYKISTTDFQDIALAHLYEEEAKAKAECKRVKKMPDFGKIFSQIHNSCAIHIPDSTNHWAGW